MAIRIERSPIGNFGKIDIVYPEGIENEPSIESLRSLRDKAFAYVCNDPHRVLSGSQHEAIERFVAEKKGTFTPGIKDELEKDDNGSCMVMIAHGNVFELYGDVPRCAQLTYSTGESNDHVSHIGNAYPGTVAIVNYQFTGI
ncbi:hypothetical protein HYU94_03470 [Candidatus Daviesbacteria bacterium]|nr:hypothetical protein [Candidatus Daviesbacteria bacterium]